jgi:thiol:disulfide interchange protein DsbA
MKRADARIKAYGVDSTPSVVINGKYRVTGQSAGGSWDKLQELVLFLVEKEAASGTASDVAAPAAPAAAD